MKRFFPKLKQEHTYLMLSALFMVFGMVEPVWAGGGGGAGLGAVAENVRGNLQNVGQLIAAAAYVAGIGFAVGAIMKFKQHKDNPTQIPIGTPLAMLVVAAALLFFPTLIQVAGETVFGSAKTQGSYTGANISQ